MWVTIIIVRDGGGKQGSLEWFQVFWLERLIDVGANDQDIKYKEKKRFCGE